MNSNTQHELDELRKPRVHITYDLEVGDTVEEKELPLVVGVIADLSGQPENPLPPLRERKFIEVNRETFDKVMSDISPRLDLTVADKVTGQGSTKVELKLKKFEDFNPGKFIFQVDSLKNLMEIRQNLLDLIAKLDGNDKLQDMLIEILRSPEKAKELASAN
ncbi:MAG: type VI secretion system contractile sheath small subunit [Silvanigrellaceae bacterium]|nr:type VI secretion system contractile sheath small subunit [Silvanigrellaceae bacterium]